MSREDVRFVMQQLNPDGMTIRRRHRLVRRTYSVKGPNCIWHVDGYDKLKPYGICISGCVDGYSRKVLWLRAGTTNNDPAVVAGYFVEAIERFGGCPQKVRTDFGTENVTVFTDSKKLLEALHTMNWKNSNLLLMTSGNFDGLDFVQLADELLSEKV